MHTDNPLGAAQSVLDVVSRATDDMGQIAIWLDYDDCPEALMSYAERRKTQRLYGSIGSRYMEQYCVPMGLLAWYAMGHDPRYWPGRH